MARAVKFAGFPFFIRSDVVEKIPFEGDIKWNVQYLPSSKSECFDLQFCLDATPKGYRVLCDTRIFCLHLKGGYATWKIDTEKLLIGRKGYPSQVELRRI